MEWNAGELAESLGLPLRGDRARRLTGAAMLEDAGPEHLAFIASPKYFDAGGQSRAGCLIAPPEFPGDGARTIIQSPQPRAHFAQALMLLYPARKVRPGVHPSACIEEGAHIDPSAEIGPFVTIGAGARIGARTRIGAGSVVEAGSEIGEDC